MSASNSFEDALKSHQQWYEAALKNIDAESNVEGNNEKQLRITQQFIEKISEVLQAYPMYQAEISQLVSAYFQNQLTKAETSGNEEIIVSEVPDRQVKKYSPYDVAGFYVQPYYSGPHEPGASPEAVHVMAAYDKALKSVDPKTIFEVKEKILSQPDQISFITLFVLSARLYDVGLRDDATFVYDIAKARHFITRKCFPKTPEMAEVLQAGAMFIEILGSFINAYAFGDIEYRNTIFEKSVAWTQQHRYEALFMLPFADAKMDETYKKALKQFETEADNRRKLLKDEKNLIQMVQMRKQKDVDRQYRAKSFIALALDLAVSEPADIDALAHYFMMSLTKKPGSSDIEIYEVDPPVVDHRISELSVRVPNKGAAFVSGTVITLRPNEYITRIDAKTFNEKMGGFTNVVTSTKPIQTYTYQIGKIELTFEFSPPTDAPESKIKKVSLTYG